ncbi:MAG: PH domain-containing protein [Anaerolineae bacterium]|nr:PH domain-containing protein [Anaerolineae bacterium]
MSQATRVVLPDRAYLVKLYLNTLLIFLVFIFPLVLLGLIPELGWAYVILFLIANALWLVPTSILLPLYFRSIRYELREDEIVVFKGIITRSVKVVPYRTVTNLHLARGPLDRLLGMGTLKVETAGLSGQTASEAVLSGLRDYEAVHELVREELRRYRRISGATTTEGAPEPEIDRALGQLLKEVREIKEILRSR